MDEWRVERRRPWVFLMAHYRAFSRGAHPGGAFRCLPGYGGRQRDFARTPSSRSTAKTVCAASNVDFSLGRIRARGRSGCS